MTPTEQLAKAIAEAVRAAHGPILVRLATLEAREADVPILMGQIEDRIKDLEAFVPVPGPAGRDGDVGPMGPPGPSGTDGRDGLPGQPGRDAERGEKGEKGDPGTNGRDGVDGTLETLTVALDEDGRTLRFVADEFVTLGSVILPHVIDRGVYQPGAQYLRGDGVTLAGSFFIAQTDICNGERPEASPAWRLAVKSGRHGKEGKEGKPGAKGERGEQGPPGRDYR